MSESKIKKAVIREDLLSITKDYRKAILLNQFIYWSERVSDADKFIEKENEIAKNNGEVERELFYGWIYKTAEEKKNEIEELKKKLERQETATKYAEKYINSLKNELKDLEIEIEEEYKPLEIEIEKLRKNERELSKENAELHCELQAVNAFQECYPTEPIKVADMLISAERVYEHNPIEKALCGEDKGAYRIFDVSELRQIAEHLLVYCNHNGEAEE